MQNQNVPIWTAVRLEFVSPPAITCFPKSLEAPPPWAPQPTHHHHEAENSASEMAPGIVLPLPSPTWTVETPLTDFIAPPPTLQVLLHPAPRDLLKPTLSCNCPKTSRGFPLPTQPKHTHSPGLLDASQGHHNLLVLAHVPVPMLSLSQGAYHPLLSSMSLLLPFRRCPRTCTTCGALPLRSLLPSPPLYFPRSSVHVLNMLYRKGPRRDASYILGPRCQPRLGGQEGRQRRGPGGLKTISREGPGSATPTWVLSVSSSVKWG